MKQSRSFDPLLLHSPKIVLYKLHYFTCWSLAIENEDNINLLTDTTFKIYVKVSISIRCKYLTGLS